MTKKNRKGNLRKSVERENLMPDDYTDELAPSTSPRNDSPSQYTLRVSKKALDQLERKSNWQDEADYDDDDDDVDSEEPSDVYDSDGENVIMTRRKTDLVADRKLSQLQAMVQASSPKGNGVGKSKQDSKGQNAKGKKKPVNANILKKGKKMEDEDEEEEEEEGDLTMGNANSNPADAANNIFAAVKSTEDLSHIPDDYNDLANMGWHPVLKW